MLCGSSSLIQRLPSCRYRIQSSSKTYPILIKQRNRLHRPQLRIKASTDSEALPSSANSNLLPKQAIATFASGAVLGPFCDGLHSSHDVLHYHDPSSIKIPEIGFELETCWWVPLLFGMAGVILGVSYPLLDEAFTPKPQSPPQVPAAAAPISLQQQQQQQGLQPTNMVPDAPSWASTMVCISLFVIQYHLSAVLQEPLRGYHIPGPLQLPALDVLLFAYAGAQWVTFDATAQGLFMSVLTAVCGPLIEIALINGFNLYDYSHPDMWGIPTWIPWVYFCGGPAVGRLGRRVWATLKAQQQ